MVAFPVNSIFRSLMSDISPLVLVQVQTLFSLCFAKLLYSVDPSNKFTLINGNESRGTCPFYVEMGGVNQMFFSNEFMAKFPNFHRPYLLYFLGLFIPVSLWGIPKGIDALVPIENDIFPEKAFCVSGSTCTHEENQNVIRWWTQIVMGLLLMMWNRMSSHRIRDIIVHLTPRISTQACRDLSTYFKNALPFFYLAISNINMNGIFPKGNWGGGSIKKSIINIGP